MKILFVSSGNSGKISPIIQAQMDSLIKSGVDVDYFLIVGKGLIGYFKNIKKIRKKINYGKYDIVHAHFAYSAIAVTFARPPILVVSLMGSDINKYFIVRLIARLFSLTLWDGVIVKSTDMYNKLGVSKAKIIPNGVDFEKFVPMKKGECQKELHWNPKKKHILFAANPNRKVKNFVFAKRAFDLIANENFELHALENISHSDMPFFFNASDVVILTSLWEGSPNVIKEALACNRPIVSTDSGDVKQLLENIKGCYVTDFDVISFSNKIIESITFSNSDGREKISNLNSRKISLQIREFYSTLLNRIN
jgi:teichuronic acid biosynthesis glycosyltransferase TuaC